MLAASPLSAHASQTLHRDSVKFEIPYFTVSGIQVRYLKIIEKSGYSVSATRIQRALLQLSAGAAALLRSAAVDPR